MNLTDPIADMLTRIRNANSVGKDRVDIPASKVKTSIGELLKDEGFINDVKLVERKPQNMIRVYLKYGDNDEKVISGIKRISKPGLRVYVGKDEVPQVLGGLGIAVISTSQGVMSDKEARDKGIGGEVVCYVW
jgi:small subunit ribosomal protein S8